MLQSPPLINNLDMHFNLELRLSTKNRFKTLTGLASLNNMLKFISFQNLVCPNIKVTRCRFAQAFVVFNVDPHLCRMNMPIIIYFVDYLLSCRADSKLLHLFSKIIFKVYQLVDCNTRILAVLKQFWQHTGTICVRYIYITDGQYADYSSALRQKIPSIVLLQLQQRFEIDLLCMRNHGYALQIFFEPLVQKPYEQDLPPNREGYSQSIKKAGGKGYLLLEEFLITLPSSIS